MCNNPECEGKGEPLPIDIKFCPFCGKPLSSNMVINKNRTIIETKEEQKTKTEAQPQQEASSIPSSYISTSSFDFHNNEDGCFSKGWKIAVGIFWGLGALCFLIKACS